MASSISIAVLRRLVTAARKTASNAATLGAVLLRHMLLLLLLLPLPLLLLPKCLRGMTVALVGVRIHGVRAHVGVVTLLTASEARVVRIDWSMAEATHSRGNGDGSRSGRNEGGGS